MTFNIRFARALDGPNDWYRRRDMVFEVIDRRSPHVLGLQEVLPAQLEELLGAFPRYGAIADRRYGGRSTGAYAPILFDTQRLETDRSGDFWLSAEPDGPRARGWDAAVPRVCTWAAFRQRPTEEAFVVFNSHFDQRGVRARVNSARLVVERLERFAHLPRLFTADLNANERSEAMSVLGEAGMRDTFRVVHPDAGPAFTYHRFRGAASRGVLGKIDHVLCDAKWRVTGAEIVRDTFDGRLPSDHYPVTAELAFAV